MKITIRRAWFCDGTMLAAALAHPQRRPLFARLEGRQCVDATVDCAGWAASGECEKNPGYMLSSCAKSCTRCEDGQAGFDVMRSHDERMKRRDSACDDLDADCEARRQAGECHNGSDAPLRCPASCRICRFPEVAKEAFGCDGLLTRAMGCERHRKRCARPPNTPPLVQAGDIDRTMRRILSDFPQHSPRALSWPGGPHGDKAPWVITLQDFLSDAEAQAFIDGCSHSFQRSLAGDQLSPVRTSSQCWCSHNACSRDPLSSMVARRIANVTRVPDERYFEPFQVLRYEPGQFYRSHHDQNSGLFTPQGARVYTFFMYLSTVESGGGTRFTDLNVTVPAVKGSAVLWPSVTDHDPDLDEPLTHHEGLPPDSGLKFAANVWVHNFDYRTPSDQGCPMAFKNTH